MPEPEGAIKVEKQGAEIILEVHGGGKVMTDPSKKWSKKEEKACWNQKNNGPIGLWAGSCELKGQCQSQEFTTARHGGHAKLCFICGQIMVQTPLN